MSRRTTQYLPEPSDVRVERTQGSRVCRRRGLGSTRGFTLIELMLVISILGLMATMASPSFFSMRDRARYAGCVLIQRQIHEIAILYGVENDPGTVNVRVTALTAADYISPSAAECPSSRVADYDDFVIEYVASEVDALVCDVMGGDHLYTP